MSNTYKMMLFREIFWKLRRLNEEQRSRKTLDQKTIKRLVRYLNKFEEQIQEGLVFLIDEGTPENIHLWVESSFRMLSLINRDYAGLETSNFTARLQNLIDKLYSLLEEVSYYDGYIRPHLIYAIGTCEFFLFQMRLDYDICFDKRIFLAGLTSCLSNLREELLDGSVLVDMKYFYAREFIRPEIFDLFEKSMRGGFRSNVGLGKTKID